MIKQQLKLIFRISTIRVRPWLYISIQSLFILVAGALAYECRANLSDNSPAIFWLAFVSTFFSSINVGISCITTALSAASLRLPSANNWLALRAIFFMLVANMAPYIVFTTITHLHPWWLISILFMINASVLAYMTLPMYISVPLYFLIAIPIIYVPTVLHLRPTDSHSILHVPLLTVSLYAIAWMRFKIICRREHPVNIVRASMVENVNRGRGEATRYDPIHFYFDLASFLTRRSVPFKNVGAIDAMRVFLGPQFSRHNWRSGGFTLFMIIAIATMLFAGKKLAYSTSGALDVMMVAIGMITLLVSILPGRELVHLLRKDSSDLSELALLPGLATDHSLFRTLQRAIRRPLLQTAAFTVLWLVAALLILKMMFNILIITVIASGLALIFLQLIQILHMFWHGMRMSYEDRQFQWQSLLILSAEGALIASFLTTLNRVLDSHLALSDLVIPALILTLTSTTLFIVSFRWYQQLKALPHPFVEAA